MLCYFIFVSFIGMSVQRQWNYHHVNEWGGSCQTGNRQSPIDLVSKKFTSYEAVEFNDAAREPISGSDAVTLKVLNDGHTIKVHGPLFDRIEVSGGGLKSTYRGKQLHFHWGIDDGEGSEHTVDGKDFPLEMHLVTYKAKFKNLTEAVASGEKDALAAFGVLHQVKDSPPTPIDKLRYAIGEVVPAVHREVSLRSAPGFSIRDLFPDRLDRFFRYGGSVTTPSCAELVSWTVFRDVKSVKWEAVSLFRKTKGVHGSAIEFNKRPLQKLGDRVILTNSATAIITTNWGAFTAILLLILNRLQQKNFVILIN